MLYPIGLQNFEKIRQGNYIYVDKTLLIYQLVKTGSVYFLSRPRRFGKSLLVSTLEAYFQGRKDLFSGLAIETLDHEWVHYEVLHLDFSGGNFREQGNLENFINTFLSEKEAIYGRNEIERTIATRFSGTIQRAYLHSGKPVVVLVDEYDKPILDVLEDDSCYSADGRLLEDRNRETLKELYSTFKSCDKYLKFIFLTGVTKFSQVSIFSGFNQPEDISMSKSYEALCGITKDELLSVFAAPVAAMAAERQIDVPTMFSLLKRQYDGYHFGRSMTDIFNPFSLLNALKNGEMGDYWFATGTPTYLLRLLDRSNVNIQELIELSHDQREFSDYKADRESPLPMLYQSGYLTVQKYNPRTNRYYLDFPNEEVANGFISCLNAHYFKQAEKPMSWLSRAIDRLEVGELEIFMTSMKALLAGIPYSMHTEEKERYFQYTFYLTLRLLGTTFPFVELCTSEGRIDMAYETEKFVYIFEFKRDASASVAMKQIQEKHYADKYADDLRRVFLIGANFSTETWNLDGWEIKTAQ